MQTLFALLSLAWPQLLELGLWVWLGSIVLMFVVFYLAMLALHAAQVMHRFERSWYRPRKLWRTALIFLPMFFCVIVLLIATAYDWLINHTSAALLFWDRAREPMVTGRLERYKRGTGWRKRFADVVCTKCLDWADPSGRHCK